MSDDILTRYPGLAGRPQAMALLCRVLVARGQHADAYALGRAALAAAPADTAVRDLVRGCLTKDVPQFHLRMLRDGARNACYAAAIARLVTPGMRVLDIGTGAGLLALLAARAGAEVVTCEANPVIAAAAREIVAANGLADRITVVAKRSTELQIGVDLPARCDLLVSEIFGDDLVEEGVLPSLRDARARLLVPGAPVVPPRAGLRCALVMHERLDRLDRPGLDDVLGFDLSAFAVLTRPDRHLSPRAQPHVALRSDPVSALAIDFEGAMDVPAERIALTSTGGRVDGIAHWLRIDFGDGVVYESPPFAHADAHWLIPVHALAAPRETVAGEEVLADVRVLGDTLIISAA
ncbi:hypothetical protein ASE86_14710 [Sphingomonas sp. Leaf33]|uniref:50S ribosomal protein L11 methyltransferase n=1 Tax=Sphingomonas sp. Leaf33 TaxID=1736215 RepID=UPI0006F2ED22|nr:50S ribosomal protein L11 methyltransferase [Sphingomonas sp. Leaf33]KQN21223.1 hypothetical protein ASE86_14710 [Sphingomonas sp. Leaf33]